MTPRPQDRTTARPRPAHVTTLGRISLLTLALTGLVGAARLVAFLRWTHEHPCWRHSNATWCGHFCDDDPCACPDRHATPDPFGDGPSCPDP